MSIHRLIAFGVVAVALAGCMGAAQPQWTADKPLQARQQDFVECLALAAQAAQGAGSWSSDRAIRAGVFENTRDQYLAVCLSSRGWYQGPATPAPEPVLDTGVFRQCGQVALVELGLWDGPVDGEDSPRWAEVWERYLDSHVETSHDHRQASIRLVLDRDLAAIHERINWATCTS